MAGTGTAFVHTPRVTPIRIRYNRLWGPAFVVLAAVNAVVFAMTGAILQLLLGAMLLVVGVLYITQPFLVIGDGTIHAKNLVGLTIRRFQFGSLAELEVVPGGIVVGGASGQRQRLKLSSWMIAKGDLDRLAQAIEDARRSA